MSTVPLQYESFDAFSPFSDQGPYRAEDYWQLPEGEPCELIQGRFIMSPSPTSRHQTIIVLLSELLLKSARQGGGVALCAPMDVVFSDDTILQPDLLYIAKQRREIVKQRIEGPPDLVIEILSPGTERRDRLAKLDLYARYGVSEYWIVDPASQLFEFLLNEDGRYVVLSQANDEFQSPRLPEVKIQLSVFWKEVTERLA
ncbi:MAG: Uma2 family endonuclease [Planctomycetes bacterium]|nr:Uma2 family endonuclease [Planctomycetota bacterium]